MATPVAVGAVGIESGLLMWILAITQDFLTHARQGETLRESLIALSGEPCGNGRVVSRGAGIGSASQCAAGLQRCAASLKRLNDGGILVRTGQHGNMAVVLGGSTDQGRTTDVDVLNAVISGRTGRDGCLKRVKIDGDQIDRRDLVLFHLGDMSRKIATTENATVNLRNQCFDATVEDFRKAGVIGDFDDGKTGIAQGFRGTAGGQDFCSLSDKGATQFDQSGLVGDGKKGALYRQQAGLAHRSRVFREGIHQNGDLAKWRSGVVGGVLSQMVAMKQPERQKVRE